MFSKGCLILSRTWCVQNSNEQRQEAVSDPPTGWGIIIHSSSCNPLTVVWQSGMTQDEPCVTMVSHSTKPWEIIVSTTIVAVVTEPNPWLLHRVCACVLWFYKWIENCDFVYMQYFTGFCWLLFGNTNCLDSLKPHWDVSIGTLVIV